MAARTPLGRSALGLAIYSLCVVFVLSFLLFEVLDVDGSDFPKSAAPAVAAEPSHADVRRLHLDVVRDVIVPPIGPSPLALLAAVAPAYTVAGVPPVPLPPGAVRSLLARASLDVPPSA